MQRRVNQAMVFSVFKTVQEGMMSVTDGLVGGQTGAFAAT